LNARWLLTQAAQHLATHPGPLGVFFRRIARRKHRNVAVVATARKLVVTALLMLKAREPYRYSLPESTKVKLAAFGLRLPESAGRKVRSWNPCIPALTMNGSERLRPSRPSITPKGYQ
jgi:hypothetical protein